MDAHLARPFSACPVWCGNCLASLLFSLSVQSGAGLTPPPLYVVWVRRWTLEKQLQALSLRLGFLVVAGSGVGLALPPRSVSLHGRSGVGLAYLVL